MASPPTYAACMLSSSVATQVGLSTLGFQIPKVPSNTSPAEVSKELDKFNDYLELWTRWQMNFPMELNLLDLVLLRGNIGTSFILNNIKTGVIPCLSWWVQGVCDEGPSKSLQISSLNSSGLRCLLREWPWQYLTIKAGHVMRPWLVCSLLWWEFRTTIPRKTARCFAHTWRSAQKTTLPGFDSGNNIQPKLWSAGDLSLWMRYFWVSEAQQFHCCALVEFFVPLLKL